MSTRALLLASAATGLLGLVLVLSWNGVLPGGWRLRGIVWSEERRAEWVRTDHAAERLELFRTERDTAPAGSIVFLGSSTIERFPLSEVFPYKPCLNRGVNGDTTKDLLQRLDDSLPAADPAGFVLNVGGNDLRRDRQVAAIARDRAAALMDELQQRYPSVPICVIGLFPSRNADEAELYEFELYNLALRRAAVARKIPFIVAQREPLTGDDGRLAADFAADEYHLNDAGYRRLGEWMLQSGGAVGRLLSP